MSGWTPSQAEGERGDDEGVDQTRGLSERHAAEAASEKKGAGTGDATPDTPSQAEGGRTGEEGGEQDRGGAR
ncbi:hypothetical protein F0L17_08315 [Streptomyces sp. TRM43335]|uniref:Uncharacterized protein n=1 Tax=Streptomyces taklimakanensis TaxID=2569853 RepID=A0A6G2BA33_9ACTN|nr:hypothetical protein [Streptomyces taklimakanensis]MTE19131.1 hypothetical protein [Streptomyces taklimakanensis]